MSPLSTTRDALELAEWIFEHPLHQHDHRRDHTAAVGELARARAPITIRCPEDAVDGDAFGVLANGWQVALVATPELIESGTELGATNRLELHDFQHVVLEKRGEAWWIVHVGEAQPRSRAERRRLKHGPGVKRRA